MKKTRPTRRWSTSRRPFTLIELMTVIGIMLLLLGIAVAPFGKLLGGTGVPAGARMVSAQLRLARQYALSQRETVAVVMPSDGFSGTGKRYVTFRSCVVESASPHEFIEWIPETRWEFMPKQTVIAQIRTQTAGSSDLHDPPSDSVARTVNDVDGDNGVRALVFAPNGRLLGNTHVLYVVEGTTDESGNMTILNRENAEGLEIDTYTGRVSYR